MKFKSYLAIFTTLVYFHLANYYFYLSWLLFTNFHLNLKSQPFLIFYSILIGFGSLFYPSFYCC